MKAFGVEQVRGSSSRRGPQALLELTSRAELGYDLAVTPGGPRGPRYAVQKSEHALPLLLADGSQGPVADQLLPLLVPETKRERLQAAE